MTPYDFSLLLPPPAGESNTQAWLDARRGRVTASSRAHKLITARDAGLLTMMEEMAAELQSFASDGFSNRYTEHGHAFEDQAINEYCMMRLSFGVVQKTPGMFVHPNYDVASATPDFFEGKDTTGQVKCPYILGNHLRLLHFGVQPTAATAGHAQYYTQVQFESFVTGRHKIVFVSYHPDAPATNQIYIETMDADLDLHSKFRTKLDWLSFMLANPQARNDLAKKIASEKTVKGIDGIPELF